MPIKRFKQRRESAVGFAKIGTIRKGAKKTGNAIGKDLTYFRYVPVEGEESTAVIFNDVFGKEPREVNILLPFDEIDRVWEEWQEEHVAGGLKHRCDGETCILWRDGNGVMQTAPRPCPGGCKETGKLNVIIPQFKRLGYVEVLTTSIWDIIEIGNNLAAIKRINHGKLSGVPLLLKRRQRKVSTPVKGGGRARREKWLVSVEADPEWVEKCLAELRHEALPNGRPLELPERSGNDEGVDTVTGEIVDDELQESESPAQPVEEPAQDGDDEARLSPEQQAAYYFTLPSGKMLGQCGIDELLKLKDWCDARPNQANAQVTLLHVNVMLDYVAPDAEI